MRAISLCVQLQCQYPYLYHTTEEDGAGGEGLELYKECIEKAGGIGEVGIIMCNSIPLLF